MIRRLVLENFMTHERTELELGPGLTAITGPNNAGKSAIVEALRCVATNPAFGKNFIRHGCKSARVEIELDDGTRVAWIRKPKTAGYELFAPGSDEPEEFWKLGQSNVPEPVQERLRLDQVALEEGKRGKDLVDVHIGNQREPVFLLNLPGTRQAAFFASSSEGAHLLRMQKLLKDKVKTARTNEAATTQRMEEIERSLDGLAPLPGLALRLDDADERLTAIESLERAIPELEQLCAGIAARRAEGQALRLRLDALAKAAPAPELQPVDGLRRAIAERRLALEARERGRARLAVLETARSAPELSPTAPLRQLVLEMARAGLQLRQTSVRAAALAPLKPAGELQEARRLAETIRDLRQTAANLEAARARGRALASLRAPDEPADTKPLESLLVELRRLRAEDAATRRRAAVLDGLAPPGELQPSAGLETLIRELRAANQRQEALKQSLADQSRALEDKASDIAKRVEAIGNCPLCGQQLDAEQFLEHFGDGHV